MKTLIIKDLARTTELDRSAMSAVRGGWNMAGPSYEYGNLSYTPSYDGSLHATQNLFQQQSVVTPTANGSAFIGGGVDVNNHVSQDGKNKIVA